MQRRKEMLGPTLHFWDIWNILEKNDGAKIVKLHSKRVVTHPSNRGTLGLNGHNCHRNGREIDKVGIDLNELNKACAFEMCPFEPKRSEQINFNKKVIAQAKGLLADLNGKEDSMSIGTGHFTGWVRAIDAGCTTPYKELTDGRGRLYKDRFTRKDRRMGICIEEGWDWFLFPWQADVAWPELADLG